MKLYKDPLAWQTRKTSRLKKIDRWLLFTVSLRLNASISISESYFWWNLRDPIVQGPIPPGVNEHCEALVAMLERLWSCPSFIWSAWAMIAGNLQVKTARAESGDERGEKTTDFHQNRLSNQMGTVRELGQSGWGGTVIGQISTHTRQ